MTITELVNKSVNDFQDAKKVDVKDDAGVEAIKAVIAERVTELELAKNTAEAALDAKEKRSAFRVFNRIRVTIDVLNSAMAVYLAKKKGSQQEIRALKEKRESSKERLRVRIEERRESKRSKPGRPPKYE